MTTMSNLTNAQIAALWWYARKHRIGGDELQAKLWPACREYYDYLENLDLYWERTDREEAALLELADMLYPVPGPDDWTEAERREADLLKQLLDQL